jgi:hypothetical protein
MAGPWGVLPAGLAASTTEVGDGVNGRPLGGRYRWVRQRPPLSFEDYVDGGPHGGRCRWVRQRPPQRLEMTLMAGPLGALPAGPTTSTVKFEDDIDGGPP